LFHWGHKSAVEKRAKKIGRMVGFIFYSLRTKNYDQFVASFSNPGNEPDALQRRDHRLCFQMRFSPTCWYDAIATYPRDPNEIDKPHFYIQGGGDDSGVLISGNTRRECGVTADLHVPQSSQAGRDARSMVRALQSMPGWSGFRDIERALGMID
jgi:hypothetical protein